MIAFGNSKRMKPTFSKFPGNLSVTTSVPRSCSKRLSRYRSRISESREASRGLVGSISPRRPFSRRRCRKSSRAMGIAVSSPPAETCGWLLRICSTRVVPERGSPIIKIGRIDEGIAAAESLNKLRGYRAMFASVPRRGIGGTRFNSLSQTGTDLTVAIPL